MTVEELIDQHGDDILRLCLLYMGERQLAEDAFQETFVRAWRHLSAFRGESSAKTTRCTECGSTDACRAGLRLLGLGRLDDARFLRCTRLFLFSPCLGLLFTRKGDGIINLSLHLLEGRKQRTIGHKNSFG